MTELSTTETGHTRIPPQIALRMYVYVWNMCVYVLYVCVYVLKNEQSDVGKVSNTVHIQIHKGNPDKKSIKPLQRIKNGVSILSMYFYLNETKFVYIFYTLNCIAV